MDITTMRITVTLVSFACFVGIWVWAYSRRNKARFDEAANLPFADEPAAKKSEEQASRSKSE